MAARSEEDLANILDVLLKDPEANAEGIVKLARSFPFLLPRLMESGVDWGDLFLDDVMAEGEVEGLAAAKEAGLITRDNAAALLKDAARENRFPARATLDWALGEKLLEVREVTEILEHRLPDMSSSQALAVAQLIPLSQNTRAELLRRVIRNVDHTARSLICGSTAKPATNAPSEASQHVRLEMRKYPLVNRFSIATILLWGRLTKRLAEAQRDAEILSEARAKLSEGNRWRIDNSGAVEDLKLEAEKIRRELRVPQDCAPPTPESLAKSEVELEAAATYLDIFRQKYGPEALQKIINGNALAEVLLRAKDGEPDNTRALNSTTPSRSYAKSGLAAPAAK